MMDLWKYQFTKVAKEIRYLQCFSRTDLENYVVSAEAFSNPYFISSKKSYKHLLKLYGISNTEQQSQALILFKYPQYLFALRLYHNPILPLVGSPA